VIFASGGLSALVGALIAGRLVRRFGLGPSMLGAALIASLSQVLMVLAAGPPLVAAAVLIGSRILFGLAAPLLQVNILSLQQSATPQRLLGRVNATMGVIVVGTLPVGALVGGALGEAIGLRGALAVGVLGIAFSAAIIWRSPLRALREPPAPPESPPVAAPAG
jgi:MFS family permease